jgi:hypothetical protein
MDSGECAKVILNWIRKDQSAEEQANEGKEAD